MSTYDALFETLPMTAGPQDRTGGHGGRRHVSPPARGGPAAGNRRPLPRRSPQDDVRASAAWIVDRTLASLAPVDSFLASALPRYDERDQGLLRELVLGTLRWLRRIDHVLEAAASRPLAQMEPAIRGPLRVAVYQLLFLDRVPAHAIVDEAVEQTHQVSHRGAASFVNAVLRRIARTPRPEDWPITESHPARKLAIELSHPDLLVERWVESYGFETTRAILQANNRPKPMHLLAFRDRGGRELLAESLLDAGIEVEPSSLSNLGLIVRAGNPLGTEAFRRGDFYIQDEASQVAAWVPPPRAGERVLDAAAAPGGKSLALLAAQPDLKLVAADISLARMPTLAANLRRLRRSVPMLIADAGAPALAEPFDRVVLDLPCTGTGTLRKHPELKWRISEYEILRLASLGERLLRGGAALVAPGGLLVALTCSIERDENEGVVARFLDEHPSFRPLPLEAHLRAPIDRHIAGPGCFRLLPADDHDGFTVHVLERAGA